MATLSLLVQCRAVGCITIYELYHSSNAIVFYSKRSDFYLYLGGDYLSHIYIYIKKNTHIIR